MRSAMVVFQFTNSIILIIGTFVIYKQMDFIMNKKLGFNKDQVIMIHGASTLERRHQEFYDELKRLADVENASGTNYLPTNEQFPAYNVHVVGVAYTYRFR